MKNKKIFPYKKDGGQAMIIAVLFFLFISLSVVLGIVAPITKQFAISHNVLYARQSYYLAESGLEDMIYRLKANLTVPASATLNIGEGSVVTTVGDIDSATKSVSSTGNIYNRKRTAYVEMRSGVGVSFNYGVQTGTGGFSLSGTSTLDGNVYSNGDITLGNNTQITGSAISANSASLSADQNNDSPTPISSCTSSNCINFGQFSGEEDFAQSFKLSTTGQINKFSFYIKKVGNPSNATVRVVADNNGSPGSNNLLTSNGTLLASQVTTTYGWVDVVLPSNPELTANTTYWVIIETGASQSTRYYTIGANNSYANGSAKTGRYNGSWSATNLDGYFKAYLGGFTGTISGGGTIGENGVGDAWAHVVDGMNVEGDIYCQSGSGNNKSCDTSRPDPSPYGFPISDGNIADWKDEALAGGTTIGNVSISNTTSLGPKKIDGNLSISSGGDLVITGTIWVTGTVNVTGGGEIRLDSGYNTNSGTIVADGNISLGGNGEITGSGQTGSYILLLTTSDCPYSTSCSSNYAISMNGGSGALILNAQKGEMNLTGGATLREATAKKINGQSVHITYESGLINPSFRSGPGGSWVIDTWKEIE